MREEGRDVRCERGGKGGVRCERGKVKRPTRTGRIQ